jgi:hypothetical protein
VNLGKAQAVEQTKKRGSAKDGSGSGSGRVSVGFGSRGFGFGDDFSPTVFGFGFLPVDIQWISEINHLELKLMCL